MINKYCTQKLKGVCATQVKFLLKNDKLYSVEFTGGCNGNLKAIARLIDGMDAREVAAILRELRCGNKLTSCGDQFAQAIDRELT
jgi:uncharacterized protein (TIGR03905 family)